MAETWTVLRRRTQRASEAEVKAPLIFRRLLLIYFEQPGPSSSIDRMVGIFRMKDTKIYVYAYIHVKRVEERDRERERERERVELVRANKRAGPTMKT